MENHSITFQITKKATENTKFFVYRNKNFPFNFDLMKQNSLYFYEDRKLYKNAQLINLLRSDEENAIELSDSIIETFIRCCQNQQFQIDISNIMPLQYLAYKYKVTQLITITDDYIASKWENLVFQSFFFKSQLSSNLSNFEENFKQNFFDTTKEEDCLSSNINNLIDQKQLLSLSIPILDRIFQKLTKDADVDKIIDFLFKCLDKHGRIASVLFSYVDFKQQRSKVVCLLLNNYKDIFDFNMINSTLLETTNQLTSDVAKIKEDYEVNLSQMKQLFEEQRKELIKIKNEYLELSQKMREREENFQNEFINMKCEMKNQNEMYVKQYQQLNKKNTEFIENSNINKYMQITRTLLNSSDFIILPDDLKDFIIKEIIQKQLTNNKDENKNNLIKKISMIKNLFDATINSNNIDEQVSFIKKNINHIFINLQMAETLYQKKILKTILCDLNCEFNDILIELEYNSEIYIYVSSIFNDDDDEVNNNDDFSNIKISLIVTEDNIINENLRNKNRLYKITISQSVESLAENSFDKCTNIKQIECNPFKTNFQNAFPNLSNLHLIIPFSDSLNKLIDFKKVVKKSIFTKITIPSSVTSIGVYCFSNCSNLDTVLIPSSVTSIGKYCFLKCSSLKTISIPSSVTSIGDYCFYECSSIKQIIIQSPIKSLGSHTFENCRKLTKIEIPSSVTSIGDYCFSNCSSLKTISIPSSVTSIGDYCFYKCTSIEKIIIPPSVTSIGDNIFCGCSSLNENSIPSTVEYIGDNYFK